MNVAEHTPLYDLHVELGAKLVDFAGYSMPVQFAQGIIHEHRHTRTHASLFDVSHMVQLRITGDAPTRSLERLVPSNIVGLAPGCQRYTVLTNDAGGIIDDIMVTHESAHTLLLIVNSAQGDTDVAHLQAGLAGDCDIERLERGLLALQGPAAAAVLTPYLREPEPRFLETATIEIDQCSCFVSRSGYTGEDGFEIAMDAHSADRLARCLLAHPAVEPAGLGARDSLRLEAGLCLYGNDLDTHTSVVEAGLQWTIAAARRTGGDRAGGFPGASILSKQLAKGAARRRVGIRVNAKPIARRGTELFKDERNIGLVTSGGFSPSLQAPIGMAYVATAFAEPGTVLTALVRNKRVPSTVTKLPFLEPNYFRGDDDGRA